MFQVLVWKQRAEEAEQYRLELTKERDLCKTQLYDAQMEFQEKVYTPRGEHE